MEKLGYGQGRKYSPPTASNEGGTEEIKASGSTFAAIIKSGIWTAEGFKSYLDIQRDEALKISRLLLENAASNSEDDEIPEGKDRGLRSRINTIPMILKRKEGENIRIRKRSAPSPSNGSSDGSSSSISPTSEGTEDSSKLEPT